MRAAVRAELSKSGRPKINGTVAVFPEILFVINLDVVPPFLGRGAGFFWFMVPT